MRTPFYPLYMQNPSPSFFETKRHLENMWTLTPHIEGLTETESISVYAGNFDAILDQIRAIPSDTERDGVISRIAVPLVDTLTQFFLCIKGVTCKKCT